MRRLLDRTLEMRLAHQRAQRLVADLVLRIEREPIGHGRGAVRHVRPGDRQHGADDRLHTLLLRSLREGHGRVEPIAVGQRRRRKAKLRRLLSDGLGLDRSVEHGVTGEDPERDKAGVHRPRYGQPARFAKGGNPDHPQELHHPE
jgi:hypothetical protein